MFYDFFELFDYDFQHTRMIRIWSEKETWQPGKLFRIRLKPEPQRFIRHYLSSAICEVLGLTPGRLRNLRFIMRHEQDFLGGRRGGFSF